VLEKLKYIKKALEKSNDLAAQCERLAVKCQAKNLNSKELSKKELELSKCVRDSFFISLAFQPDISNAMQLSSNAKNLYQILDASRILYSVVRNAIPTLLPIVKQSILELENELLRTQIKKLQNDVLDRTKQKDEQDIVKRPKTRSTNSG
jgi:hypothetical protein